MRTRLNFSACAAALVLAACAQSDAGQSATSDSAAQAAAAPPANAVTPAENPQRDSLIAKADRERILGDPAAPVWVVMVEDFECPVCREAHERFGPMLKQYVAAKKIRLAYLNFPLAQHPHAIATAETAMCSALQGKFWPVHDALFKTQSEWRVLPPGTTYFVDLAAKLGVAAAPLRECLVSQQTRPIVAADRERGMRSGVTGTPTFFIGKTHQLTGAPPESHIREAIEAELRAAGVPGGARGN